MRLRTFWPGWLIVFPVATYALTWLTGWEAALCAWIVIFGIAGLLSVSRTSSP